MTRSLAQHLDPAEGPKRILALDGGGVKGVLTLGMLEALEAELRRRSKNSALVLSDYYDLIGGTSTGSIIAAGLALGMSTSQLIEMYLGMGPKVFGKTIGDGGLFKPKYDGRRLREALNSAISDRTLGSEDVRTGLAIFAKRIDTGSAWALSNHPNSRYFDVTGASGAIANKNYLLADLVQASAAAPTFFDEVKINIAQSMGRGKKPKISEVGYFVDGAVGANNNPSMQLLIMALVQEYGFGWRGGQGLLMMTSLGTGIRRPRVDGRKFHGLPPGFRGIHTLRAMIYDTQLQGIMLMQGLSNPIRPWVVNSEIMGMREGSITDQYLLDYQRMDVRLEKAFDAPGRADMMFLEDVLGREVKDKDIAALDELANGKPAHMEMLLKIGRKAGTAYVSADYPNPHFDLPGWGA